MTRKISHAMFAIALALGMLAAISNPSHAALSTAERTDAVVAPAAEQTTLAAVAPAATVAAPVAAAATPVAAAATPVAAVAAPVAAQPRKTIAHKANPQRFAAAVRAGYPCH
jgi:hypothetical protein